jgi:hypothetical protein
MTSGVDVSAGKRLLTSGARMSAGGGEGRYRFGNHPGWAVGRIWGIGRMASPWPFLPIFLFLIFLFYFTISLITFAKKLQNPSNHFQKFSKIQRIISIH